MPISPDAYSPIEDALNRLATESMLAQAGRDDGMVPTYSLLGDLADLCAADPAICVPVASLKALLEKSLDEAKPFTAELLATVRGLSTWLLAALGDLRSGSPARSYASMTDAAPPGAPAPEAKAAAKGAAS